MGSDKEFVAYVVEHLDGLEGVSSRMMFGEYAIFYNGKMVALICDNQLFVKPTEAGRAFIGVPDEAPPYPGAKPAFLISDRIEDRDWLSGLVTATEKELPMPKKRKKT